MRIFKYLFLLILLVLCSCSAITVKPDINLIDLRIREVMLLETTLLATLRIHNDSNQDFTFNGSNHIIYVNGSELGKAVSDEAVTVPRFGSKDYSLPVRIGNISAFRRIQNLIDSRNFEYKINSTLYLPGSFGLGRVSTSNSGKFEYR